METGGTFLVGYKGRLFIVHSDYQVAIPSQQFAACGCGQDIALGSLYSTASRSPLKRIELALKASQEFSAGVREPFHIIHK